MKLEIRNKDKVTRSNKIAIARYKLNATEQKLLYILCSKIQPDDEDFHKHTFDIKEIANHCGLSNPARDLQKACLSISKKPISISDGDSWQIMPWLSLARYNGKTGTVELELNYNLKPYLLGLKEKFTSIKLEYLIKFNSSYSGRIYELVKSLQNQGCNKLATPIDIDELKLMFGVEKEYRLFGHFKSKVLDLALAEINATTPENITYELIKTGRKVTHIRFDISKKEDPLFVENIENEKEADQTVVYDALQSVGVIKKAAKPIVDTYSSDRILGNVKYVIEKQDRQSKVDNIAGYVLKAIENDYAETEQQSLFKKERDKQAAVLKKKEEALLSQHEQVLDSIPLTSEQVEKLEKFKKIKKLSKKC